MKRRDVIKGLIATPAIIQGTVNSASASTRKPLMMMLYGVTLDTPADILFAIVDPLVSSGIPVSFAVAPASRQQEVSGLRDLFAGLLKDYSGLVEICVDAGDAGIKEWYPLARSASEAQTSLRQFYHDTGHAASRQPRLCLVTQSEADPTALRTAGFRIAMIRPESRETVRHEWTGSGVMLVRGGTLISDIVRPELLTNAISADLPGNDVLIFYLGLSAFDGMNRRQSFEAAAKLADGLSAETTLERVRFVLPSEFAVQYAESFSRLLMVRIDGVASGHPQFSAQTELIAQLRAANIPVSYVSPDFRLSDDMAAALRGMQNAEICISAGPEAVTKDPTALAADLAQSVDTLNQSGFTASCVVESGGNASTAGAIANAGAAIVTPESLESQSFSGLDSNGLIHVPLLCQLAANDRLRTAKDVRDTIIAEAGSLSDAVIAIRANMLTSPEVISSLRDALATLSAAPENSLVSLGEFARRTLPPHRTLDLLRSARRGRTRGLFEVKGPDETERANLIEDAGIAWTYFKRFGDRKTGFAPASAWIEDKNQSLYPFITMWDCGSELLALVASHSLRIIGDKEFLDRAATLVAHLHDGDRTADGMRLPKSFMSITGNGQGESGYDASDMGRLLVALKVIETYSAGAIDAATAVAGWDLVKTIINGRIHSFKDGKMIDIHHTAYANYVARGFSMWGFAIAPPFSVPVERGSVDELLNVLEAFARAEPVGAEPHVLEEVELGHSHISRLISDILYQAQIEKHRATGQFVCVSEGPLDRDPWFTYQGYKILSESDPWIIETIVDSPRYETEGFRRANEIISTKSAFMWAGVRPQDYSRDLLDYVRARARIEGMGFSSGIFAATGRPMSHYSDLNTNAEILEAAAYILNGHKPLHLLRMGNSP